MQIITEEYLRKQAPSVFSTQSHAKTSEKYAVIPTIECIVGLQKAGFYPVSAKETKCRLADNRPFAKHMIRFRREEFLDIKNLTPGKDFIPEIVMSNSHNGTSSYQLRAGIYRLVCSNGLIVGNDLFYRKVRHQGNVIEKIVESAGEIIDIIPSAIKIVDEWKKIKLTPVQQTIYAESASLLRWDEDKNFVSPERMLAPIRLEDQSVDLWTTYNIVQEKIIRGGLSYFDRERMRRGSTRSVTSVSENAKLNIALWNLTEKMQKLVA